jgi:hypothetical protein
LILIALDGVPVGTQAAGASRPTSVSLPGARRAEFIVSGPDTSVATAQVVTLAVDTGPAGDVDPERPLILIVARNDAAVPRWRMPIPLAPPRPLKLPAPAAAALLSMSPNVSRRLFFSQDEVRDCSNIRFTFIPDFGSGICSYAPICAPRFNSRQRFCVCLHSYTLRSSDEI